MKHHTVVVGRGSVSGLEYAQNMGAVVCTFQKVAVWDFVSGENPKEKLQLPLPVPKGTTPKAMAYANEFQAVLYDEQAILKATPLSQGTLTGVQGSPPEAKKTAKKKVTEWVGASDSDSDSVDEPIRPPVQHVAEAAPSAGSGGYPSTEPPVMKSKPKSAGAAKAKPKAALKGNKFAMLGNSDSEEEEDEE